MNNLFKLLLIVGIASAMIGCGDSGAPSGNNSVEGTMKKAADEAKDDPNNDKGPARGGGGTKTDAPKAGG